MNWDTEIHDEDDREANRLLYGDDDFCPYCDHDPCCCDEQWWDHPREEHPCPECGGDGMVDFLPCPACGGDGTHLAYQ